MWCRGGESSGGGPVCVVGRERGKAKWQHLTSSVSSTVSTCDDTHCGFGLFHGGGEEVCEACGGWPPGGVSGRPRGGGGQWRRTGMQWGPREQPQQHPRGRPHILPVSPTTRLHPLSPRTAVLTRREQGCQGHLPLQQPYWLRARINSQERAMIGYAPLSTHLAPHPQPIMSNLRAE